MACRNRSRRQAPGKIHDLPRIYQSINISCLISCENHPYKFGYRIIHPSTLSLYKFYLNINIIEIYKY